VGTDKWQENKQWMRHVRDIDMDEHRLARISSEQTWNFLSNPATRNAAEAFKFKWPEEEQSRAFCPRS
jgi:hypothetical protein